MPWTAKQRQLAARACQQAGIGDAQRRDVILRQFANARMGDGRISSTAPKLNNADFESFMAIVEGHAGGQLLHFSPGYWQCKAQDHYQRMRYRIGRIVAALEAAGLLNEAGVAGWIEKRVSGGATRRLEDLDYHGLLALITGLSAYARQRGVEVAA